MGGMMAKTPTPEQDECRLWHLLNVAISLDTFTDDMRERNILYTMRPSEISPGASCLSRKEVATYVAALQAAEKNVAVQPPSDLIAKRRQVHDEIDEIKLRILERANKPI